MKESGDIGNLFAVETRERRHAAIRDAGLQKLAQLFAILVAQNDQRPGEIGTGAGAAGIRAMAKSATDSKQLFSTAYHRRIELRSAELRENRRRQRGQSKRRGYDSSRH